MGHMLVDNPQPVTSGGDDEAVVNLSEGPQVFQGVQTLLFRQNTAGKQGSVGIGNGNVRPFRWRIREIKAWRRRWRAVQREFGQYGRVFWFGHRRESHVFHTLREL